jgi:hypothetical protein
MPVVTGLLQYAFTSILVPLLKAYLAKLATQQVADFVVREVAQGIVKSTVTKQDDYYLEAIEAFVDGRPVPPKPEGL